MGKNKNKNKNKLNTNVNVNDKIVVESVPVKPDKNAKTDKNAKVKQKKQVDSNKKTFGAKTKETFSELKKVAWPKFGKVAKATSIVVAVVAIFTIVLFGIDFGLSKLHKLLIK